jgi:hypothetical protein
MHSTDNARGYLLIHRNWYELPDEPNPLKRNAIVSSLNPVAFEAAGMQIVKRSYEILEPPDVVPFAFTICECRPVGPHPFDTLEDAEKY